MSNYRPISILTVICKFYEKVVAEQLVEHFEHINVLQPYQFGFRKRCLTESNCCYLLEIKSSLDSGGVVVAVFLDLRKAFDTVSHQRIITRLSDFSLDTNTVAWSQSYLNDSQQCVVVDNKKSALRPCSMGVPQGSILSPLLFTLYINCLPTVCKSKIMMYGDDTVANMAKLLQKWPNN